MPCAQIGPPPTPSGIPRVFVATPCGLPYLAGSFASLSPTPSYQNSTKLDTSLSIHPGEEKTKPGTSRRGAFSYDKDKHKLMQTFQAWYLLAMSCSSSSFTNCSLSRTDCSALLTRLSQSPISTWTPKLHKKIFSRKVKKRTAAEGGRYGGGESQEEPDEKQNGRKGRRA